MASRVRKNPGSKFFNFADLQKSHYYRQWALINWIAIVLSSCLLIFFSIKVFVQYTEDWSGFATCLIATLFALGLKFMGDRLPGRVMSGIWLAFLYFACVYLLIAYGGVNTGTSFLLFGFYVAVALNMGRAGIFGGAALIVLTLTVIQIALDEGYLPAPQIAGTTVRLIVFAATAILIAILLHDTLDNYYSSFKRNEALVAMLQESEHRHKTILNNIPDMILRINLKGQIIDRRTPRSRETESGHAARSDPTVSHISELFNQSNAIKLQQAIELARQNKISEPLEIQSNEGAIERFYECRIVALDRNETILILRDVTRKQRESLMRDALHAASDLLLREQEPDYLCRQILHILENHFHFKWNAIGIFDHESQNELRIASYIVDGQSAVPDLLSQSITKLMHEIATTGQYEIETGLHGNVRISNRNLEDFPEDLETYLAVPIRSGRLLLGVIWLGDNHNRPEAHFIIDAAIIIGNNVGQYLVQLHNEKEIERSLREKEILLQEVHHRVKNNLQLITSLLDLQLSDSRETSPEEIFKQSARRIRSIALVHEKLYQTKSMDSINVQDYVRNLVTELEQLYGGTDSVRFELHIDPIKLDLFIGIPLGIIINELVTNSFKHAFKAGKRPIRLPGIDINIRQEDGKINMSLEDNGQGFPEQFNEERDAGLGLKLIDLLVKQLGARWQILPGPGARFEFTIPYSGPRPARLVKY